MFPPSVSVLVCVYPSFVTLPFDLRFEGVIPPRQAILCSVRTSRLTLTCFQKPGLTSTGELLESSAYSFDLALGL